MAITITENAADRVKTFLGNRGKGVGLRVRPDDLQLEAGGNLVLRSHAFSVSKDLQQR